MGKMTGKNNFLSVVAIYGAGSHGKVVLDMLLEQRENKKIDILCLFDDNPLLAGRNIFGFPIRDSKDIATLKDKKGTLVVAIADNARRAAIVQNLAGHIPFSTVIHASAVVSYNVRIGEGCMISARAVINPDAIIGDHTIINTGAIVEHDNIIGSFCHIAPGVCLGGSVRVGDFTEIFTNATVLPDVTIGNHCVVGAGAVVLRDVLDYVTVVGNPARILRKN